VQNIGKPVLLLIAGFAAGVAFIAACGSSGGALSSVGPGKAAAQAACASYDVQIIDTSGVTGHTDTLPKGWIPFAFTSSGRVVAFQCSP
jgi:hypothetical protein